MMPTTRRRRQWSGLGVVLVAVVWIAWPRGGSKPAVDFVEARGSIIGGAKLDPVLAAVTAAPAPEYSDPVQVAPDIYVISQGPTADEPAARARFREHMSDAFANYAEFSVYPPWSRPFDDSVRHLAEWNPPMAHRQVIGEDEEGHAITAEVTLDRVFADRGESVTAWTTVWREGDGGKRTPVAYDVRGELRLWPGVAGSDGSQAIAAVPFAPPAAEDAMQRTATFVPSALPSLRGGVKAVQFVAWVSAGSNTIPFTLPLRYALDPPFEIVGHERDRIVDGSLQVELRVRSAAAGTVRVMAVLYDAPGTTALAVFDRVIPLAHAGEQTISVTFFGRILREKAVDGPYTLRALHGDTQQQGSEGAWKSDTVYTTAAYHAKDFSDREWSGTERDDKFRLYDQAIEAAISP